MPEKYFCISTKVFGFPTLFFVYLNCNFHISVPSRKDEKDDDNGISTNKTPRKLTKRMILTDHMLDFGQYMDYDVVHYDDYGEYVQTPFPISPMIPIGVVSMPKQNIAYDGHGTYAKPFMIEPSINTLDHSSTIHGFPHFKDFLPTQTASTHSNTNLYHNVVIHSNLQDEYITKRKLLKS